MSQKIRPCHKVGQLFIRMPSEVRSDGKTTHSLTPDQIWEVLGDDPAIMNNCKEAYEDPSIPPGPGKLARLSIWISNLTSESAWNGKHGGATIEIVKQGNRKIVRYVLVTPELLNIFGQVMHSDAERLTNTIMKDRVFREDDPLFPGSYHFTVDENGHVVKDNSMQFFSNADVLKIIETLEEESKVPAVITLEPTETDLKIGEEPLPTEEVTEEVTETVGEQITALPNDLTVGEESLIVEEAPTVDFVDLEIFSLKEIEEVIQIEEVEKEILQLTHENNEEPAETPVPDVLVINEAKPKKSGKKKAA